MSCLPIQPEEFKCEINFYNNLNYVPGGSFSKAIYMSGVTSNIILKRQIHLVVKIILHSVSENQMNEIECVGVLQNEILNYTIWS